MQTDLCDYAMITRLLTQHIQGVARLSPDPFPVLRISVITQNEDTALMMAAREGRTEVVSLLLEAGANTDLQNEVECTDEFKSGGVKNYLLGGVECIRCWVGCEIVHIQCLSVLTHSGLETLH